MHMNINKTRYHQKSMPRRDNTAAGQKGKIDTAALRVAEAAIAVYQRTIHQHWYVPLSVENWDFLNR